MTKLDDLIHNEHMMRGHQSIAWRNQQAFKESEDRIKSVLKLFGQSEPIKHFLVKDFFKRGKDTVLEMTKNQENQE